MDDFIVFPDKRIAENGPVSKMFIDLGIKSLHEACRYVHELPYGYNSNSDDLMILFKEKKGTCTTKHAVIGTLAQELALPVHKNVGRVPIKASRTMRNVHHSPICSSARAIEQFMWAKVLRRISAA